MLSWLIGKNNGKNLAVFIDGPNMLRKEFQIDLTDLKQLLQKHGKIKIAKVFLNQYAPQKLIEACTNQGFQVITTVSDIDVAMAAHSTSAVFNSSISGIVLITRDADFLPVIQLAKEHGKETIVVIEEEFSSSSLKHTADQVIVLSQKK